MPRVTGRLIRWFTERGFGFVSHPNGTDHFVHWDAITSGRERVRPGATVAYEAQDAPKGPRAVDVEVLQ